MILDLFILTIIVVFIIDLSGIIDTLKRVIWKLFFKSSFQEFELKPLDCSLCMTWWSCLGYIIITNQFSLYSICVCALFSFSADLVGTILHAVKDIFGLLLNKIIDTLS